MDRLDWPAPDTPRIKYNQHVYIGGGPGSGSLKRKTLTKIIRKKRKKYCLFRDKHFFKDWKCKKLKSRIKT